MELRRPTVVVIGAGAAGLAAAQRLYDQGDLFDVRVLEAQERTGGRVFSQYVGTPSSGEFVELGAQWIHGENHPVYEFAKAEGLVLEKRQDSLIDEDEATGEFMLDSGRPVTENEKDVAEDCLEFLNSLLVELEKCEGWSAEDIQQRSMGDFVKGKFEEFLQSRGDVQHEKLRRAVYDWFIRYQLVDNGCFYLSTELSIRAFSDYGVVGDNTVRLRTPLSQLLQKMSSTFPCQQIHLNQPVKKIRFINSNSVDSAPVVIQCEDGQLISADHVIMTASLGVLKASPDLFDPALPENKRLAIKNAGFGTISKLLLQFECPFWENLDARSDGFQLLWMDKNAGAVDSDSGDNGVSLPWYRYALGLDVVRTAKNTLVLWLAGAAGPEVDMMLDEEVLEDTWHLLCKFTGSDRIPKPVRLIREPWSTNPFTRGTYSFYSLDTSKAGILIDHLVEPVWEYTSRRNGQIVPAMLFAGEATHPRFFSTVHGAILSGWREADRLIALH